MIKAEPVDIEELTKKRSRRGRKRKTTESENELTRSYEREDNEYKKKRLRNNIAVRKSRDKGRVKKYRHFSVSEKQFLCLIVYIYNTLHRQSGMTRAGFPEPRKF